MDSAIAPTKTCHGSLSNTYFRARIFSNRKNMYKLHWRMIHGMTLDLRRKVLSIDSIHPDIYGKFLPSDSAEKVWRMHAKSQTKRRNATLFYDLIMRSVTWTHGDHPVLAYGSELQELSCEIFRHLHLVSTSLD